MAAIRASWRTWAVPVLLFVWSQIEIWVGGLATVSGPRVLFAVLSLACCAALLARRVHPVPVAVTVSALLILPASAGWFAESSAQVLMLVVSVFACGRYGRRPLAYLALPLGSILVLVAWLITPGEDLDDSWGWSLHTLWIFALGAAFRNEAQLRERALQASDAQARASAAEARLHVARELHDVLSHSLAVVVVQAEVADTYFDREPERSHQAVRRVAETARAALTDTRRIVDMLRDAEAAASVPSTEPGLRDVPALVDRVRESGLPVALDMDAGLPVLSEQAGSTGYRVIQESLTNVLRHAGRVPTVVKVGREANGELVIEVSNGLDGNASDPSPEGRGLVGMRERVAACGGRLTAGPGEGHYRVRAVLPGMAAS